MLMTKLRLADLNLNIKTRELVGRDGFGFGVTDYSVQDSFPTDRQRLAALKIPTVVVTTNKLFGRNVELGSRPWGNVTFTLDVFANTDGQRDDLAYYLWSNLTEKTFTFFDFNDGFPSLTTAISYIGITANGNYFVDEVISTTIAPPLETEWEGENHHQLLLGTIRLAST